MNIFKSIFSHFSFLWLLPFGGFFAGYVLAGIFFGAEKVSVPNIVGLPIAQALRRACDQRLHIRVLAEKVDPEVEPGIVLNQRPEKDQLIKQHQTIFITLSKQPAIRSMPLVVGKLCAQVISDLQAAHGTPVCIRVPSSAPHDLIIAQYPAAGDPIKGAIYLYTATQADERVLMPNVVGRMLVEVKEFLNRFAINLLVSGIEDDRAIVTQQRPLEGTVIDLAHPPTIQVLAQAGSPVPLLPEPAQESQTMAVEVQTEP